MPRSPNPLRDMGAVAIPITDAQRRPGPDFVRTALPGFKRALEARRSIRAYDAEPVPESVMRDCLRDAILAPSASNLQVYELYWVRDSDRKRELADACLAQPAATSAGELVVVVARADLWKSRLDAVINRMTHGGTKPLEGPIAEYYGRIVPMMLRTDSLGAHDLVRRLYYAFQGRSEPSMRTPVNRGDHRIYGHVQASLAAQTLMLSIAAHGYDSCPLGGMDKDRIARSLDLPYGAEVSMVIAVGRGLPEGLYGPRLRLDDGVLIKEV